MLGYLFQNRQCDDITGCFTGTIPGAEGEGEARGGGSESEGGPRGILLKVLRGLPGGL